MQIHLVLLITYWDSKILLIVTAFMNSLGKVHKCVTLHLAVLKCGVTTYFVISIL